MAACAQQMHAQMSACAPRIVETGRGQFRSIGRGRGGREEAERSNMDERWAGQGQKALAKRTGQIELLASNYSKNKSVALRSAFAP